MSKKCLGSRQLDDAVDCLMFKKLQIEDYPPASSSSSTPRQNTLRQQVIPTTTTTTSTKDAISQNSGAKSSGGSMGEGLDLDCGLPVVSLSIDLLNDDGGDRDDDHEQPASDTSEVNSNDDAVSIASRLSQIVVEQEVIMGADQMVDSLNRPRPSSRQSTGGLPVNVVSAPQLLKHNKSFNSLHASFGHQSRPSGAIKTKNSVAAADNNSQYATIGVNVGSSADKQLPGIEDDCPKEVFSAVGAHPNNRHDVTANNKVSYGETTTTATSEPMDNDDNDNDESNNLGFFINDNNDCPQKDNKQSIKLKGHNTESAHQLAANFLPERGDLRSLGLARNTGSQQLATNDNLNSNNSNSVKGNPMRLRSNTVVEGGDKMLNIRRSAWTLAEFERTFHKQPGDTTNCVVDNDNSIGGGDLLENATATTGGRGGPETARVSNATHTIEMSNIDCGPRSMALEQQQKSGKSNLLIRASRNALNLQQQQQQQMTTNNSNFNMKFIKTNTLNGQQLQQSINSSDNCNQHKPGSASGCSLYYPLELPSGRRPSRAHSICSISSSLDSFHDNGLLAHVVGRRKKRRKHTNTCKSANNGNNDYDTDYYGKGVNKKKLANDDDDDGTGNCCLSCCCSMSTLKQFLPVLSWLPKYKWRECLWGDITAGLAVAVLNISTSLSAAVVAETNLGAAFRSSIVNTFIYALLCSSRHTSFGSWSIMSQMLLVSVHQALNDELILYRINLGPTVSWDPREYEMWHMNIIIMYTFLIGLAQLVSGLLNLGNILASFIPSPLCSSMIAATAITMAIGQLANMCGTSNKILWAIERNTTELWADLKNPQVDITDLFAGTFKWIQQIALLVKYNNQVNMVCVIISIVSVIILALNQYIIQAQLKRSFRNKNIFVPIELILLILMIIASYWFDLANIYHVTTCGPIHIDFQAPSLPNLRLFRELWFDSLATALISYTMVFIMAKTYSNKLNYEIDCNQELIACGAGNLIGSLCDALPATASFSRTAGQVEAGGKTQMASFVNCIVLVLIAHFLGHHVAVLPVCVMSATLFYGFIRMSSKIWEAFDYWRLCKVDFAIWLVTFVAIITLDMVNGFLYGFIFSILTMLYRAQNRRCYLLGSIGTSDVYVPLAKYPIAKEIDGIKIFQFCGPIHYVCSDLFERLLRQKAGVDLKQLIGQKMATNQNTTTNNHKQHQPANNVDEKFNPLSKGLPSYIILDFSMISYIDSSGIHVIKKIIDDYNQVNIKILLASLASHVASVVKSEPSLWNVYKERFYVTLADAVHCAMRDNQRLQKTSI